MANYLELRQDNLVQTIEHNGESMVIAINRLHREVIRRALDCYVKSDEELSDELDAALDVLCTVFDVRY